MDDYFSLIEKEVEKCYKVAGIAREKGLDQERKVEISLAKDLAERVEELVGPKKVAGRIREILNKMDREEASLFIAKEVASGKFCDFKNAETAIDQAIRTGLAILTEGVLVAPLDGIAGVRIDGYVDLSFAGPIRSAGGTGQAMSILIADVVRRELGIGDYVPTSNEVERYKEELPLYDRIHHLQYSPSPREIEAIVKNCPICINGEGTEKEEVTGNRNLPRVKTNRLRGGACLVIAEGLCLKAPKISKHVARLKLKGWEFLKKFGQKKEDASIEPSFTYMKDLIAGRPVLSHPSRKGGFRLRYGRARTAGLASTAINPATMELLDGFIATGTQMKMERPGKGTISTPCDSIEGPILLLKNRDLIQVNSFEEAKKLKKEIEKIVDLGEILIPFGEFAENNAILPTASYSYEWWIQELEEKGFNGHDIQNISAREAFKISEEWDVPLHPSYNLFWHDVSANDIKKLGDGIKEGIWEDSKLILPANDEIKEILINLGALHEERNKKIIIKNYAYPLIRCCGLDVINGEITRIRNFKENDPIKLVSKLSGIKAMPRSPSRIGARMGRPEKAAPRKMKGSPHVLYPIGMAGGKQRLVKKAAKRGKILVEIGKRICERCGSKTNRCICECGGRTFVTGVKKRKIDVKKELNNAEKKVGMTASVKGVKGMTSKDKIPEALEKGILRAVHDLYVFKDGTVRFDQTNAPLTHFRPREIGTSINKLRKMGYKDWKENELKDEEQICELKPQDLIPSRKCGEYLFKVSKFLDDLLEKFYEIPRFYRAEKIEDLIGHLVVGLSPHTSAGVVGRIIGFTNASVCYSHPLYHAAKRRNCDGDEDASMLLMDCLINFSHHYIPEKRGGNMDLPLVITTGINPSEVDKEVQSIDLLSRYPLEFYRATVHHKHPREIEEKMDLLAGRIGTDKQYDKFSFTHDTSGISIGPTISAYKTLKTMDEKVDAQLELAEKILAVDENDVALRVIQTHFLPDMLGNLRAFGGQGVRCTKCDEKYRRMPLKGICLKCGGKLTLTVHGKSVKKYLEKSKEIAKKYEIPSYTRQRIQLVEKAINSIFMNEKVKKTKLSDFL